MSPSSGRPGKLPFRGRLAPEGPSIADAPEPPKRKRRWPIWLLWAVSVLALVGGLHGLFNSATFPRAIAQHPVRIEAIVTQSVINGLGGDPSVEYEYRVGGHLYKGEGFGKLGHESVLLPRGATVTIEYAADAPSESCTCDAAHELPPPLSTAGLTAAGLALPLIALISWQVPRLWRTRRSWFAPIRGVGEWAALLVGVPLGFGALAFVLAWFFAVSLER